ncbi:type IX secretion system membrane protein PorP/SprF [Fulvivirgaceae bacterium BMA10]|uniref:Type IX secretion system membrane protein PorP/SprF n=1 Tax=Splendidivirga corallicola TaxID=3051826 RepID=A0ABT8KPZ3_9BACT|nr:type IX secretion system membrane protein PorP/SprF [Fulvivirgaceae bacterium BMA10]
MPKRLIFRVILVIICSMSLMETQAQQRAIFSQYIFDGLILNPAYAGSHVQMSTTITHRDQWINFEGAPKTQTLSTHVGLAQNKVGLGLLVGNDQVGIHKEFSFFGSYAYKIKFPTGTLSMGLQAGFNHRTSDFNQLTLSDNGDPYFIGRVTKFSPNFGTGVYYYNEKFFAGFSIPYLLNNKILDNTADIIEEIKETRNYYLTGGLLLPMNRTQTIMFKPSVLIRAQEGAPLSFDLTANVIFYDIIGIGSTYRNIEGIITYINLRVLENLYFGYGYDWTQSDINNFSNGSHEFTLNYRIRLEGIHKPAECPSYFQLK